MTKYNYLEHMTNDVIEYIRKNLDRMDGMDFSNRDSLFVSMHDVLQFGNVTDHFSCKKDAENAENCLYANWGLLLEVVEDFDTEAEYVVKNGPTYADYLIRCYLLSVAIDNALDILEANGEITYGTTATV